MILNILIKCATLLWSAVVTVSVMLGKFLSEALSNAVCKLDCDKK